MAASDQPQPTETEEEQSQAIHKKDVTITAYSELEFDSSRSFINHVLGDLVDFSLLEKRVNKSRRTKLEVNIEEEVNGNNVEFNDEIRASFSFDKDALLQAVDGSELPEWIEFSDTVEKTSSYRYPPNKAVKSLVEDMLDSDALEEFGYEENPGFYLQAWTREVEDLSVDADPDDTISYDTRINVPHAIEQKQVLTHQAERSQENRFEGEDEHWSFQISIHIEADNEERLNNVSEALVPEVYSELASLEGIDNVRISGCTEKVERTGECYNL